MPASMLDSGPQHCLGQSVGASDEDGRQNYQYNRQPENRQAHHEGRPRDPALGHLDLHLEFRRNVSFALFHQGLNLISRILLRPLASP